MNAPEAVKWLFRAANDHLDGEFTYLRNTDVYAMQGSYTTEKRQHAIVMKICPRLSFVVIEIDGGLRCSGTWVQGAVEFLAGLHKKSGQD